MLLLHGRDGVEMSRFPIRRGFEEAEQQKASDGGGATRRVLTQHGGDSVDYQLPAFPQRLVRAPPTRTADGGRGLNPPGEVFRPRSRSAMRRSRPRWRAFAV